MSDDMKAVIAGMLPILTLLVVGAICCFARAFSI